jgi:glycosyltransferase involved in cell wall biosynthesis
VSIWGQHPEASLRAVGLRLVRAARRDRVHVLMVLETGGGGAARHVVDLSRGLIDRGYCVTLAYSAKRAEPSFLEEIHAVPDLQCVRIEMTRHVSIMDLQAARAIRAYLLQFGPFQVVHGHSSKGGALARIAAIGTEAARVYTPHAFVTLNPSLDRARRAIYSKAERALSHFADAIICVSREELDHALQLGIEPARLHLVPNGVDPLPPTERSVVRRKLGLEDGHVCVGFVGRLNAEKGVDRLVQAFADVRRRVPSARLALVGAGPEENALRDLSVRLNVSDATTWLGNADGRTLMAGFDIFAFPSLYEGSPYVLLEAAQRGLPIVTTSVGGADQIVADGVSGFLVPRDDTTKFAECLLRLCSDPALRARMTAAPAGSVRPRTAQQMIEETLKVYSAAGKARQLSAKSHGRIKSLLRA